MTTRAVRDNDLFKEIASILGRRYNIPNRTGYGGTGGPGRVLENLLRVEANNQDLPDAGRWELKFTSNRSYLTLFHKDPLPRIPSVIKDMVLNYGWDSRGRKSFRHTICGSSERGFNIVVTDERISIINGQHPNIVPYWDVDELSNSVVPKMRNLILVTGDVSRHGGLRQVQFNTAQANHGFKLSRFISGLRDGWIAIDFDARTNFPKKDGTYSIRNHGTKFRVKLQDLGRMYSQSQDIAASDSP